MHNLHCEKVPAVATDRNRVDALLGEYRAFSATYSEMSAVASFH